MIQTSKELFHMAGDAADPADGRRRRGAVAPGYNLSNGATAKVMVIYPPANAVLELDLYGPHDAPEYLHLICPLCLSRGHKNMLTIPKAKKAISWDPDAVVPPFPGWSRADMERNFAAGGLRGLLSIEPFACTWEEQPELERSFGLSRCGFRVVISKNVAKDAR